MASATALFVGAVKDVAAHSTYWLHLLEWPMIVGIVAGLLYLVERAADERRRKLTIKKDRWR